jgi:hypothetical protein
MQSLQWHGQHPLAKWFAITSSIGIALLAILAGTMLLGADRMTSAYELPTSSTFDWLATFGLACVFVAWALHMAAMLVLLGYNHTENRTLASVSMTVLAAMFLLFVAGSSLSVIPWCGMKSMM